MRVTWEQAADNHERLIDEALRLFREHGFDGVGVDAIARAAGLTHGALYRKFASKAALAAEAVRIGVAEGEERLEPHRSLETYLGSYLMLSHRDDRGGGCVLAALAGEAPRQSEMVRAWMTRLVTAQIDRFSNWVTGRDRLQRRRRAIAAVSGAVGALILARAVNDVMLSDEILAASRQDW